MDFDWRRRLLPVLLGCLPYAAAQPNSQPADTFPLETDLSCAVANDQPRNPFQVRLTHAEEERAVALYRRSIVITAHDHCWTPQDFVDQARSGVTARVLKPLT